MSYIAVDIGATNVRVARGDDNVILERLSETTDRSHGPDGVPRQVANLIKRLCVAPKAIGIGSIGPLDVRRGLIVNTPNFPFKNIPVIASLKDKFDVPMVLMNDCSAAVVGESVFGAGRYVDNLFYVTFSTGLGGGAIVDGHLLGGKDGNAPEIGHIVIDLNSKLTCGCGGIGHWEAYSSGVNIPKYARLLFEEKQYEKNPLMKSFNGLTTEMIFRAAAQGDPLAKMVIEEVGKVNAVGFADIINAFDPELITIGGSIALKNPDLILNPINNQIDRYVINRKPNIMITHLGDDVVLYGALAAALKVDCN